jgi:hypothetical protein
MLEDDEALEVVEVDPLVVAEVVEAAELAVADEVAPMEANALNTADTSPSPGGGGGGALLELALEVPVALVLWLWDSMVDKADKGMVSPLLVTELILI